MKMNTEDSCKGVFSFYTQVYMYFTILNTVKGLLMTSLHR